MEVVSISFWSRLFSTGAGEVPNANASAPPGTVGPPDYTPGDPDQLDTSAFDDIPESRALPWLAPSPWSGYPSEWNTPSFNAQVGINKLIDISWTCVDLNSSILASMPVYRLRNGYIVPATNWMGNPDPEIYTSWQEFFKQLIWDYMLGEAFVLPYVTGADGYP